jgi:hypothetical protein
MVPISLRFRPSSACWLDTPLELLEELAPPDQQLWWDLLPERVNLDRISFTEHPSGASSHSAPIRGESSKEEYK